MEKENFGGFQSHKQLQMYLEFTGKALELMQQEIMNKILGNNVVPID